MIPSQSDFLFVCVTLYLFFLIPPSLQYCHHDQRDALLEFKHEFQPTESKPSLDGTLLSSWNTSNDDCCSWEGVGCNIKSTKVISLFLEYIPLENSLKPNSSLFKLKHLLNLTLVACGLYGNIPSSLGNLSRLTLLDLMANNLVGEIPTSIGNLSQLMYMHLSNNQLSGGVSISISNLKKLAELKLYYNNFDSLPHDMSGLGNMKILDIGRNSFVGPFPTSLFKISSLEWVNLGVNHFKGPLDFGNISLCSRLQFLDLSHNQLDGPIPNSIAKLLNLGRLDLSYNNFNGPFPTSLFMIPSITWIDLSLNQFHGPLDFGNKPSSSNIQSLSLAENKFHGPIPKSICGFLNLEFLDLSYNNLIGSIPVSISKLVNLFFLDLSNNNLEGQLPGLLWGLISAKFSHNSFSGFEESSLVQESLTTESSQVFYETRISDLRLASNSFQGPFPKKICSLRSLHILDVSNNSFNGSIPECLKNLTNSIEELNLSSNNFSGVIPDIFSNATALKLDVSHNQLEGKLPRSLINCKSMELMNVQSNKIKDKFPSWLGCLPLLGVLLLRSNELYGPVYHKHVSIGFQSLRVIDISHNYFVGTLSPLYFSGWRGMATLTTKDDDAYMGTYMYDGGIYRNSMEMIHKGVNTEFERIRKDFRAIDFSRNKFCGEIPKSIGLLKELRLLNFSSNEFTSKIPDSLPNLKNLETLDLSLNMLSGQIPQALGSLSFLSTINFSHNNLEGPIPQSTQFQRQNCSSFMNNPKLVGLEEEVCGIHHVPNLTTQQSEELSHPEEQTISWISAAIAYVPGVLCGFVIGRIFLSHRQ